MTETVSLEVALDARRYPIHIGAGTLARAGRQVVELGATRVAIVTNTTVAAHWLAPLRASLAQSGVADDVIVVPDGEAHKNWSTLHEVLTRLLELRAERTTMLIALGGGVVGDIGGFAAAIYQRGMPFIQVPTTLLAQVDSSVGGKTGVNHPLGKNMIGAFHQPRAVLIDTDCLRTLPERELSAGLAEVVKAATIRDEAFFTWLEQRAEQLQARDPATLTEAIYRSCRIKAEIVAADEREAGERALLNFGHTFGHAIETHEGYGRWLHGEAVGAGMVLAARLSQRMVGLPAHEVERLCTLLQRFRIPVVPPEIAPAVWIELMRRDKKVTGGRMHFILLRAIGAAFVSDQIVDADVDALTR